MCPVSTPTIAAPFAQKLAAAELNQAAVQVATMAAHVRTGDSSEELLHAARSRLERTALAYAAACDWQPPPREEVPAPTA
jgi:hypothetical protein